MKYLKYILLLAVIGAVTGFYLYNKPVKSTASKSADLVIQSQELFAAFEKNEAEANSKYLDKVVSVTGSVSNISREDNSDVITLKTGDSMFGVVCKMEHGIDLTSKVKPGQQVQIKGICTGMLMDVVLMRCILE